jgi:hypothetical protein
MVVPMLLPLLAAGFGGQFALNRLDEFEREREQNRLGQRVTGILDQLPEGAGPDAQATALARGGLLDPAQLMQYGNQEYMQRVQDEAAMARQRVASGPGYMNAGLARDEFNWRVEQQAKADAIQKTALEQQQQFETQLLTEVGLNDFASPAARTAAATTVAEAKTQKALQTAGLAPPAPVDQGRLERDVTAGNEFDSIIASSDLMMNTLASQPGWLARNVPMGETISGKFASAEELAQRTAFNRAYEEGFSRFKLENYGEAEPPPAVLDRLRKAYGDPYGDEEERDAFSRNIAVQQAEAMVAREYANTRARVLAGELPVSALHGMSPKLTYAQRQQILGESAPVQTRAGESVPVDRWSDE